MSGRCAPFLVMINLLLYLQVVVTEGPGHAQQILTTLDLVSWGGVVVVSGDGLVHEVYNGLLARPDWSEALGFPVGLVPGGSGNALVRSLVHWQVIFIYSSSILYQFAIFAL